MHKFEPVRNLLIVQNPPSYQDPADWIAIRERIERDAPDIEVRIVDNGQPHPAIEPWLAQRPSLIFSACALVDFSPRSGTVFCGHHLSSFLAKELDPEHVRARYAQFNALDRAANLLIQKTRSDAR